MMRRRGAMRVIVSAIALAGFGGGCSLIVAGDVPQFQCIGADPSACPNGLSCDTVKHVCVSGGALLDVTEETDLDAPDQPDVKDAGKDADADAGGPVDLGQKCRVDADCKSRMCGSSTTLTTSITQTTGPICTMPCCNSLDCPGAFVCFNGGTGGGYCVPATLAGRTPPATGGSKGGVTCVANGDCRSGLCTGTPKTCLDTCCTQGECGGTSTCRLSPVAIGGPTRWVCAAANPGATKLPSDSCGDSTECASDNCIGIGASRICRPPCSNSASCKAVSGFSMGHCLYGTAGSDTFKFCFSGTVSSRSAAGVGCTDDSTCQSDYCDAELKKCANVCAKDSDCGGSEACRPSAVNTPYLRCVPKP